VILKAIGNWQLAIGYYLLKTLGQLPRANCQLLFVAYLSHFLTLTLTLTLL